jgi:prepilin-type N-terminal cleavage/methylation domain-containing protein
VKRGDASSAPNARGFTLIELLLALALLTMLVTALLTFVFSMGEIWGRGGDQRLFEQHVGAVTRHVEDLLQHASWPRPGTTTDEPFAVDEVQTPSGPKTELLGFELLDGDRLLNWPEYPLPEVRCHLAQEDNRGLILYWQSSLEKDVAEKPPRATLVSPLVTKLAYAYYDLTGGSWRTEQTLRKNSSGQWVLPDRLVLSFKHGTFESSREVTLPGGGGRPPAF